MPTDAEVLNALWIVAKYLATKLEPNVPQELQQAVTILQRAATNAPNAPKQIVNVSEAMKGSQQPVHAPELPGSAGAGMSPAGSRPAGK